MNIVIFGVGRYYEDRIEELYRNSPDVSIVAYIDNKLNGKMINNMQVMLPDSIVNISFDYVITMSLRHYEMVKQLIDIGVSEEKIINWQKYLKINGKGNPVFEFDERTSELKGKKVGILTPSMNYDGGSIAAVYMAKALQEDYEVNIITENISDIYLEELKDEIKIIIYPNIGLFENEELEFIKKYDLFIVNTAQLAAFAYEISKKKPTMWWIHESDDNLLRRGRLSIYPKYQNEELNAKIFAVSSVAREAFQSVFIDIDCVGILPYGIPDQEIKSMHKVDEVVFAVVGSVIRLKAQNVFLRAAKLIKNKNVKFWLIGKKYNDVEYNEELDILMNNVHNSLYLGELSRKELDEKYREIDVLVCPSQRDSLPIVVTEAMRYSKPVIISEAVGTKEFIKTEECGLTFRTGDYQDLADKMEWMINNPKERTVIGKRGRLLYERYFSMNVFRNKMREIIETM